MARPLGAQRPRTADGGEALGDLDSPCALIRHISVDERTLVRVKLADDNDLKTARTGIVACDEFFTGLARLAPRRATGEWELWIELQSA